jgi:uncharacterized membrane-anchored protein YhcB (DUF1043 family)
MIQLFSAAADASKLAKRLDEIADRREMNFSMLYDALAEPALISIIALLVLGVAIGFAMTKRLSIDHVGFSFAFSVVGVTAGVITGSSLEPIAGALLTGMLGLVTGLLSYLFSKESLSVYRGAFILAIATLAVGALIGLMIGRVYRAEIVRDQRIKDAEVLYSESVLYPALRKQEEFVKCRELLENSYERCDELLLRN